MPKVWNGPGEVVVYTDDGPVTIGVGEPVPDHPQLQSWAEAACTPAQEHNAPQGPPESEPAQEPLESSDLEEEDDNI